VTTIYYSLYIQLIIILNLNKDEGDDEIFLVDFDKKIADDEPQSTNAEVTISRNELKLKQNIKEKEYYDSMRQKWEENSSQNAAKTSLHYEDIKFNEIRNLGVGNFKFSTDETERQSQMDFFNQMQSQTKMNRLTNTLYKLKRTKRMKERLNKIEQRKLLKEGFSLDKIKEISKYEKELIEIAEDINDLENDLQLADATPQPETMEENNDEINSKKKYFLTREWDKPKMSNYLTISVFSF
jgi:hypothetical protein